MRHVAGEQAGNALRGVGRFAHGFCLLGRLLILLHGLAEVLTCLRFDADHNSLAISETTMQNQVVIAASSAMLVYR